jgi:hypothetical protein
VGGTGSSAPFGNTPPGGTTPPNSYNSAGGNNTATDIANAQAANTFVSGVVGLVAGGATRSIVNAASAASADDATVAAAEALQSSAASGVADTVAADSVMASTYAEGMSAVSAGEAALVGAEMGAADGTLVEPGGGTAAGALVGTISGLMANLAGTMGINNYAAAQPSAGPSNAQIAGAIQTLNQLSQQVSQVEQTQGGVNQSDAGQLKSLGEAEVPSAETLAQSLDPSVNTQSLPPLPNSSSSDSSNSSSDDSSGYASSSDAGNGN